LIVDLPSSATYATDGGSAQPDRGQTCRRIRHKSAVEAECNSATGRTSTALAPDSIEIAHVAALATISASPARTGNARAKGLKASIGITATNDG
jgi:hypothetical protein